MDTPGYTVELVNGERENLLGAWVTIDYDKRTGHHHLLIVGNHEIHGIVAADLPLVGTIEESLASVGRGWQDLGELAKAAQVAAKVELAARSLAPLVSVTLYICDQAGEIRDGTRRPGNPQPKRRKSGLRMLPPVRPSTWDVGVRLGAALRAAYAHEGSESEATGRSMRPHIRRAHWHRYRVGPGRTGERARWLPPIAVKVDSIEDLPAVIRPVS